MKSIIKFVRLDYITVKPYMTLKNLILVLVIAVVFSVTMSPAIVVGILTMYGMMFGSYPFAVGEQNGIDTLYSTLSIKRKTVVVGRYLFALSLIIVMGVLSVGLSYSISVILGREYPLRETMLLLVGGFLVFTLMQMLQLPFYFKLGYAKAKFLAYLPILAVFVGTFGLSWASDKPWAIPIKDAILSGLPIFIPVAAVLYIGLYILSMALSTKFYRARDF